MPTARPRLVLASGSKYRRELLSRLGQPFEVIVSNVDETPLAGESPSQTALRLSVSKAQTVVHQLKMQNPQLERTLVIGSDQVAMLGQQQLGKPGNFENALAQLQAARGQTVKFHCALALVDTHSTQVQADDVVVSVRFRDLPDATLARYLHAEQPYDCAGSAKSEGLGVALLDMMDCPDPTALVGLPLIRLNQMLLQAGFDVLEHV